jgi:hypothetical protein
VEVGDDLKALQYAENALERTIASPGCSKKRLVYL